MSTRIIKKYANRRLYDTEDSKYVTLKKIKNIIAVGHDVKIIDDTSGEDITRALLLQILSEQELGGRPILSKTVLKQFIRLYGHPMQDMMSGTIANSVSEFMSLYPKVDPKAALEEMSQLSEKWTEGLKNFSALSKDDVQIGTTEKTQVLQQDKVCLYRYQARAKQTLKTPLVVVYGLIGRYTMADLQEDRSLIRNLLDQGVDVYAVDWGSPSRSERWLTLDDYINGYLHDCIEYVKEEAGVDQVNILGICEGGVFSLCYAALHQDSIKNLATSITPIDFHGDIQSDNSEHGYINLWTRNLDEADIDLMVETYGNMPGDCNCFNASLVLRNSLFKCVTD